MPTEMNTNSLICVAGHSGMVGSALAEELTRRNYERVVTVSSADCDLTDQAATTRFFAEHKPEYVFLIAGKVGGIQANMEQPAAFLYDNLMIAANVAEATRLSGVRKMLYLGSSCIYPRLAAQPMREEYLLTGALEPTNEAYAIGKLAGMKLCEYYRKQYGCNFIAAIPPNLYGPRDNFSLTGSHVAAALLRRHHSAKVNSDPFVEIWGTGTTRREFLFARDLADGLIFLMHNYADGKPINIGSGADVSIRELAELIRDVVGYRGEHVWNSDKPDGMPRKLMDSTAIRSLGWQPETTLEAGLRQTYAWYIENLG